MQRFKTTILLAIVLGILIVVTATASIISNGKQDDKNGEALITANIREANKIEIIKGEEIQELSKVENKWVVSSKSGVNADQAVVNEMINKAEEITKNDLASTNPEKKSSFEVDESGVEIKMYSGDSLITDFFVGKAGADFNSTYVRLAEEDDVYLTKNYIRMHFDKSDFRDLAILDFDKDQVSEIKIDQKEKEITILLKEDGQWKAEWYDQFKVDESNVTSLLSSLAKLSAKDVIVGKSLSEAGLSSPSMTLTVKMESGEENILFVGDKEKEVYYVKRSLGDTIYTVPEYKIKDMQKGKDDFELK
ncbi:DUF4340 domain-containing protein [bacterium]|nr:MAG: DUF4340 domain-containing protein [bacterium]